MTKDEGVQCSCSESEVLLLQSLSPPDELTVASLHASAVESVCGPGQISDVSTALLSRATPSLRVKMLNRPIRLSFRRARNSRARAEYYCCEL